MYSSRNTNINIVLSIYKDNRTVFRLNEIALLVGESNFQSLNKKLNYYVRMGKFQNPRKGIYTKPAYNPEEMACTVYTPSYISLEYVLQKSGIIFQYDESITAVSYLSRSIEVSGRTFQFHKIKEEILLNMAGINRLDDQINIASAERAFLDVMYLNSKYYFDNINPLNRKIVHKLLPVYKSRVLSDRVNKLLRND